MSITARVITGAGLTTPTHAGNACVGWRVEPTGAYPVPTFPVTIRYHVDDDGTFFDQVMTEPHGRWPGERCTRLELLAPTGTQWLVTLYETDAAWDEGKGGASGLGGLRTVMDTNANGGPVLMAMPAMQRSLDGGNVSIGVGTLTCTSANVPRLAARPDGYPAALRLDADGRLMVSGPVGAVLLDSGTLTSTTPQTYEVLRAALDTSGYRTLWLRLGAVTLVGGTSPTASIGIASVMASGTTLTEYSGNATSAGGVAEVQCGPSLSQTFGPVRAYSARVLRAQPYVRIGGTPTSYSVPWELYGER